MNIRGAELPLVLQLRVIPQLMRDALHVIGDQVSGREQGLQTLLVERPAPLAKLAGNKFLPIVGRDLVQKHLRPGFVEGAADGKHLLHQRRLRSGENVPDRSLLLDLVADGVLHRAAIELRDLLKFIEADGHAETSISGQLPGQGKDLRSDRSGIESRSFAERDVGLARRQVEADVGLDLPAKASDPVFDPVPGAGGAQHLLGEFLQKLSVTGIAAHRQADGVNVPLLKLLHGHGHQRTLSEAPGGEQEDLLPIGQVADELAAFVGPVDEVRVINDFTEDEGIFYSRHIMLISVTLNGVKRKSSPALSTSAGRNTERNY